MGPSCRWKGDIMNTRLKCSKLCHLVVASCVGTRVGSDIPASVRARPRCAGRIRMRSSSRRACSKLTRSYCCQAHSSLHVCETLDDRSAPAYEVMNS